jgi:hypothetical protein
VNGPEADISGRCALELITQYSCYAGEVVAHHAQNLVAYVFAILVVFVVLVLYVFVCNTEFVE